MSDASVQKSLSVESLVAAVADEFLERWKKGERPPVEEYTARHPEAADLLRKVLTALELVGLSQAGSAAIEQDELSGILGDFRIIREVGKGGMGVVYEAEQISLRRRVALKVLPFAAMMDPRPLQRFHNEAQAAACLHHTNIVPVFFVGCERGVHFYAMQLIDGQPLSEVLRQLRSQEHKAPAAVGPEQTTAYQLPDQAASTPLPVADLTPLTREGRRGREYFRKVAELGVQAAEALDHVHQLGIFHRDVKPGNLLLDGSGRLWVTDFGLAHVQHGEASLTLTGQALGTPRYMSPEQALAKRVPIDHRTDVYSLGVTLYELLTLRPAFAGEDRQELLRQIAFDDPARPRKQERAIPSELETIVLKAMEKRPQDRYATAKELADDLRHYLEHRPIKARRPSWRQRIVKWGRRHQAVVWASIAVAVLAVVALAVSTGLISAAYRSETKQRRLAEQERQLAEQAGKREAEQRREVERERDTKAYQLYVADMQRAQRAWEAGNIDRLQELLEAHRPRQGQRDLRGWEWYYLQGVSHSALLSFDTGYRQVQSLAWSPDGRRLAAAGAEEKRIQIWDIVTGEHQIIVPGPERDGMAPLVWSPDSRRLAWANNHGRAVLIWDVVKNREERALPMSNINGIWQMGWSPDGRQIAVSTSLLGMRGVVQIKIWDAESGKECRTLVLGEGVCQTLAWSPNGKRLACLRNGFVKVNIWDMGTGKQILEFLSKGGVFPTSVSWSPDSTRLAVGFQNTIKVHRAKDGKELLKLPGRLCSTWSPDGHRLATPSNSMPQVIKVWDGTTGQELSSIRGHSASCVVWSPDGKRLASAGGETIKVWDMSAEQEYTALKTRTDLVNNLQWIQDGKQLATASGDTIQIWGPAWEKPAVTTKLRKAMSLRCIAWSPDGHKLASEGDDGKSVTIRDADGVKIICKLTPTRRDRGAWVGVGPFAWDPNSQRIAFGFYDGSVRVWDLTEEKEVGFLANVELCRELAWSPDRRWLAVLSNQKTCIYETATWHQQHLLIGESFSNFGGGLTWSPDSRWLAWADGSTIKIWNLATQQELLCRGHTSGVDTLSWSPDGLRLASIEENHTVKIWELATGQEVLTLRDAFRTLSSLQRPRCVNWSPDGRRVAASASTEGVVKVWDASPGYRAKKEVMFLSVRRRLDQAGGQSLRGLVFMTVGRNQEAETAYRQAVDLVDGIVAHFPYERCYRREAIISRSNLIHLLEKTGRYAETETLYRQILALQKDGKTYRLLGNVLAYQGRYAEAVECYRQGLELFPKNYRGRSKTDLHNDLAWLLATCPEAALRNKAESVELSKKATNEQPKIGIFWNTLGVAQYRNGDWRDALTSLTMSVELGKGGSSHDFFFLAMAHWQLGDKEQARQWYARAVQWMDRNKPQDEELRRFRAEATALLNIKETPMNKVKEATPHKN